MSYELNMKWYTDRLLSQAWVYKIRAPLVWLNSEVAFLQLCLSVQVESIPLLAKKMSTTGQYVTFTFSVTDIIFTLVDWIWMMINSLQSAPSFDTHATNQILSYSGWGCCKIWQMTVYFLNIEYCKVYVAITRFSDTNHYRLS